MRRDTIDAFLGIEDMIAGLARIMSKKTGVEADELESFGRELFLRKLANKHDPARGALTTFITWCLRNAMLDYAVRQKRMIPLSDMGDFDIEQALPTVDFVWPDERVSALAEKIGEDAWHGAKAILRSRAVREATTPKQKRDAAKEALWRWMEVKMKGALA